VVPKASLHSRKSGQLWRLHAAFDLPHERFSDFELTDQSGGERIDRIKVVAGEIRIGDRGYLQPDRIDHVLEAGGDIIVRAAWNGARWLGKDGEAQPFDLIGELRKADALGRLDMPIKVARNEGDWPCVWSPSRSRPRPAPLPAARPAKTPSGTATPSCARHSPPATG